MFGVILSSKMSSFHPSIWLSFSSPFLSPLLFIHLLLLFFHLILLLVLSCPFSASAHFSWLFSWKISHMIVKRWRFFTALVVWLEDDSWFFWYMQFTAVWHWYLLLWINKILFCLFYCCFSPFLFHSFVVVVVFVLFVLFLFFVCFLYFYTFLEPLIDKSEGMVHSTSMYQIYILFDKCTIEGTNF